MVEILHDAFCDLLRRTWARRDGRNGAIGVVTVLVQRWHVDTRNFCHIQQKFRLALPGPLRRAVTFHNLARGVLSLAEREEIEEVRQRLRIHRADAAAKHDVLQSLALLRQQRHASEIEHIQDVGIAHLIADRKRDQIELRNGIVTLQRPERQAVRPHLRLHVAPRREHALAPDALHLVHHAVEDAHADV